MNRAVWMVALVLAGCAGPGPAEPTAGPAADDAAPAPGPVTVGHGTLEVVVVTPDLQPVEGATVRVQDATATTDETGTARLAGLTAGGHLVEVRNGDAAATVAAEVRDGEETQVRVKLLVGTGAQEPALLNQSYQRQFRLDGFFDCSATYLIITGDCMTAADYAIAEATGSCSPVCPGELTNEEFILEFPLGAGWQTVVAQMHWEASNTAGQKMTFAVEPAEAPADGHAAKYAVAEGGSPLLLRIENGVPHESATSSADGAEPDMPQSAGGEVLRTRSFVQGEFHRPGGTGFLDVGVALQQDFDVIVTVFYGEPAPADFVVE